MYRPDSILSNANGKKLPNQDENGITKEREVQNTPEYWGFSGLYVLIQGKLAI